MAKRDGGYMLQDLMAKRDGDKKKYLQDLLSVPEVAVSSVWNTPAQGRLTEGSYLLI